LFLFFLSLSYLPVSFHIFPSMSFSSHPPTLLRVCWFTCWTPRGPYKGRFLYFSLSLFLSFSLLARLCRAFL
jgi:hypothetical protein